LKNRNSSSLDNPVCNLVTMLTMPFCCSM
jgi:hypothetical protein